MKHSEMVSMLNKEYPGEYCLIGIDYDDRHCIFGMNPSRTEENLETNWRWVDKKTGDYGSFNPGGDFMAFLQAINTRRFL